MSKRFSVVAGIFLCLILAASAEAPSPEAMKVALKAADDLRLRLTEALRQKGHNL
jgi:hypothetical protein